MHAYSFSILSYYTLPHTVINNSCAYAILHLYIHALHVYLYVHDVYSIRETHIKEFLSRMGHHLMQFLYTTVNGWIPGLLLVLATTSIVLYSRSTRCQTQISHQPLHVKIYLVHRGAIWCSPCLVSCNRAAIWLPTYLVSHTFYNSTRYATSTHTYVQ